MRTNYGFWRILGASIVVATSVVACGDASSELAEATGGAGGGTAGKGGAGGGTAGKGGAGGGTAGKGGSGGGTAGKGGSGGGTAGTGGTAGKGGSGGGTAGSAGSTAGAGGGTAGSAGSTAGSGGGTAGAGGGTAGSAGSTAGAGGGTAGAGGGTAGAGGGTAGAGGGTAGAGGGTAGAGGGTAGAAGGTAGTGGSGGTDPCPFPPCTGTGGTGGAGGIIVSCDKLNPAIDSDGDKFFPPTDCNDCDPNINPGAIDILNTLPNGDQIDEDCSGTAALPTDPKTCDGDATLTLGATDPMKGANAIDLCQTTTGGPQDKWGIVKAEYVRIDGSALPGGASGLAHGIMGGFGPNVTTQLGTKLLGLSSGFARAKTDSGYVASSSGVLSNTSNSGTVSEDAPQGFPISSPGCAANVDLEDSIALRLTLKAPTNAQSVSFKFKFYTMEYAQYICTQFNDVFVASMTSNACTTNADCTGGWVCSTNTGAKKCVPNGADPKTGNVSFDSAGNLVSVNSALLNVCAKPGGTFGGKVFTCDADGSELLGTGFEDGNYTAGTPNVQVKGHGATTWLQTNAPVVPGQTFTVTFAISDSGDTMYDSTVLIDDFEWSAKPGTVVTGDACKLGGSGTCGQCINGAVATKGCCQEPYAACLADTTSTGCAQLLSCLSFCGTNAGCIKACGDSHTPGLATYNEVYTCFYGPGNDPKNQGACNVACAN